MVNVEAAGLYSGSPAKPRTPRRLNETDRRHLTREPLAAILLTAILIRLPGLFWGLPGAEHRWPYHPDESTIFLCMKNFSLDPLSLNPIDFSWPSLYLYLVTIPLGILSAAGILPRAASDSFFAEHPELLTAVYLIARLITLAAAIVSIYLAGAIADIVLPGSGRITMILTALFPVHVMMSTVATPHMLSSALAAAAVHSAMQRDKARDRRTGALWGLAVGALYDAWVLVVPLAFCIRSLPRVVKISAIGICFFFLSNPYALLAHRDFIRSYMEISEYLDKVAPSLPRLVELLTLGIGPAALAAAIFGFRRAPATAIWLISYAALIAWTGTDFLRRLLPLAIPCGILAASGLCSMPRTWKLPLFAITAAWSLAISIALVSTYRIGDTRTASAKWINDNVPPGARIELISWFHGPHLDTRKFDCRLMNDSEKGWSPDYFVGTELELPIDQAMRKYPGATITARFIFHPPFVNEERAPEDWFYTHPRIYLLRAEKSANHASRGQGHHEIPGKI